MEQSCKLPLVELVYIMNRFQLLINDVIES